MDGKRDRAGATDVVLETREIQVDDKLKQYGFPDTVKCVTSVVDDQGEIMYMVRLEGPDGRWIDDYKVHFLYENQSQRFNDDLLNNGCDGFETEAEARAYAGTVITNLRAGKLPGSGQDPESFVKRFSSTEYHDSFLEVLSASSESLRAGRMTGPKPGLDEAEED